MSDGDSMGGAGPRVDRRLALLAGAGLLGAGVAAGSRVLGGRAPASEPVGPSREDLTVRPGPGRAGVPAGSKLRASGPLVVTRAGATVEGLDIDGPLEIRAARVTVRGCRVRCGPYWGVRILDGNQGTLLEDSEIAPVTPGGQDGIRGEAGFTARRLDIHGTADGIKAGGGTTIAGCWVHDLANRPGDHADAVQIVVGDSIALLGNRLDGAGNAAVMASTELGPIRGLRIEGNWLDGGNYTLMIRGGPGGNPTGVSIRGNRFGRGAQYGPAAIDGTFAQSGNVWSDGKALVL
jgi:hypothetical protein